MRDTPANINILPYVRHDYSHHHDHDDCQQRANGNHDPDCQQPAHGKHDPDCQQPASDYYNNKTADYQRTRDHNIADHRCGNSYSYQDCAPSHHHYPATPQRKNRVGG